MAKPFATVYNVCATTTRTHNINNQYSKEQLWENVQIIMLALCIMNP